MPCLPVDSATSCSSHSPSPGSVSAITNVSLSRPACASALERRAQPHAAPRGRPRRPSSGRVPARAAAPRAARPPARRSATPARCRTATARCSARRCPGRRRTRPPEAVLLRASSARPEPGSVIADEAPPSATSDQKCANSDSGSIVPPDFEETTNSVAPGSIAPCTARIVAASVESSTCRRSAPVRCAPPKQRRSTSGASEEPPMPSSTTSCRPSAAAAAANCLELAAARRACARRSSASRVGSRPPACRRAPQRRVAVRQPLRHPLAARQRQLGVHRLPKRRGYPSLDGGRRSLTPRS